MSLNVDLAKLLGGGQQNRADTVIVNGKLVNVFTGEIQKGLSVRIRNGYIVAIEPDQTAGHPIAGSVIDADGRYLSPGFIDAHTHVDSLYQYSEFVPYALRGGTTTIVTETAMVANACGYEGVEAFIGSTRDYPLRCYFLAPPQTPPFPKMERSKGLTFSQFSKLLRRDDFLGIGESYWTRAIDGDKRILGQASLALSLGKTLEGHSSGARGAKLQQYFLTGITSCHESTSVDEALEKLRLGIYVMIREGFVRRELDQLAALRSSCADLNRVILVSDVFDATMLIEQGYLDAIVRKAIRLGFKPIEAIRMVTLNPADYFGLRQFGAIAPLRKADILFLGDLEKVSIEAVMFDGRMVFDKGKLRVRPRRHTFPSSALNSLSRTAFTADDFRIPLSRYSRTARVIQISSETITREIFSEISGSGGFAVIEPGRDIIPAAMIHRSVTGQRSKGLVSGTGIKNGAIATTLTWDTCNMLVIGSSENDMAAAANRLTVIRGGIVIIRQGRVLFELPMPAFGLIPLLKMEKIRQKTLCMEDAAREIGSTLSRPFLTLQTLPFTGLPFLRLSDKGLVDIKNKRLVPLWI